MEKLLEILLQLWDKIWFFTIIEQHNRGVRLRFGKLKGGELAPGFYWKIPFADNILECLVTITTESLGTQSLLTKDNINIVVNSAAKYRVSDSVVYMLEVTDAISAISDMTKGIIKEIVMERSWELCRSNKMDDDITKKARSEAKKWGIEIIKITITDLAPVRSIRLIGDKVPA